MASTLFPFLLCSLILIPINVLAQIKSNITIGDSFIAQTSTSTWLVSPSGDFAFGFLPLDHTNNNLFLLSIWYTKIPDKTVVWFANKDNQAPKGSKAVLNADDGLVLTAPNGEQLWKTGGLSVRVSHGVFNDTGNFVLQDGNFNSVWESLKDHRDKLLPSQTMEKGEKLFSGQSKTNFAKDRLDYNSWKKRLLLSIGRVDATLSGAKAFLKVRKDNSSVLSPSAPVNKSRKHTLSLVGWVLFSSSAFLNVIFIGVIYMPLSFIFNYMKKLRICRSDTVLETNLLCFSYKEVEEATNGFQKEIGRGSFGVVYEGSINIGSTTLVAVKRLNTSLLKQLEQEFKNELYVVGLTHHKNLVRLIGFCEAEAERLLVYEYMTNGTLASLLFNNVKPSWKLRLEIAFGIARGLAYLHEECSTQIIHCDIKPQNILLDDYYNAKISDFGLAKLLKMNQSKTNTAIRGTKGYVALEWFKNMPITSKVDVYSYGVLLLEIICCRRNVEIEAEDYEKAILIDWACICNTRGTFDALVMEDKEALDDKKNMEKLVMIAIWCVQEDPSLRPTMRKVTQMLEGVVEVPPPPCPSN